MRAAAATAGMVSAAVLLAPGCGGSPSDRPQDSDPLRQASFRSLAARDFLASCPGAAARSDTLQQVQRLEELKQLAVRKGAARAVALGENDWAAVARYDERERCEPGEEAYGEAMAAFSQTLDTLARRIAEYRP
jgi:hypothetical protein